MKLSNCRTSLTSPSKNPNSKSIKIQDVRNENQWLLDRIRNQEEQLRAQRNDQQELRSVIKGLQDQIGSLRAQSSSAQNGTVDQGDLIDDAIAE
jgi:predicted  nucleic acid-binding Zn-ribbon protein